MRKQMSAARDGVVRRRAALPVAAVSLTLMAAAGLLLGQAANGVPTEAAREEGRIVLTAGPAPVTPLELSRGRAARWAVDARLEDAARARIAVELRSGGDVVELPPEVRMTVDACRREWTDVPTHPACASGPDRLRLVPSSGGGSFVDLAGDGATGSAAHLLVTVSLDPSLPSAADGPLSGSGRDLTLAVTPVAVDGVPLARIRGSGVSGGLLVLLAAGALAAGVVGLGTAGRMLRRTRIPRNPPSAPPRGRRTDHRGSAPGEAGV